MAYCEIITKIGNEAERIKLSEPALYEPISGITNCIVSEIVEDIVGDAVFEAEEKVVRNSQKLLKQQEPMSVCLRTNVGDVLPSEEAKCKHAVQDIDARSKTDQAKDDNKIKVSVSMNQNKHESPTRGVGDQLLQNEEVVPLSESVSTSKHPIVEKKSRLTDLVKNSKQILSKFILTESLRVKNDEWEEKNERILSVTELDCVKRGMKPFKVRKNILPENIPLPEDADDLDGNYTDGNMETIDLRRRPNTLGSQAEGTQMEAVDDQKKTMTFPQACSSSRSLRSRFSTMRMTPIKELHFKKRKWSLGTRIINYIRKRSTKSKKESEKETSD